MLPVIVLNSVCSEADMKLSILSQLNRIGKLLLTTSVSNPQLIRVLCTSSLCYDDVHRYLLLAKSLPIIST